MRIVSGHNNASSQSHSPPLPCTLGQVLAAWHSISTIATMVFKAIIRPHDGLDLLGVEDAVEWQRWRKIIPDHSKELCSHISSDIGKVCSYISNKVYQLFCLKIGLNISVGWWVLL
jgi:hypothetical protein